jgi:O-antigen/teichoic acid export membrane protein
VPPDITIAATSRPVEVAPLWASPRVYIGAVGASYILSFVKAFWYARLMGASTFGVYSLAYLTVSLSTAASTLGVGSALLRHIPVLRGQGRAADASVLRNALMSAALAFSIGAAAIIVGVVFMGRQFGIPTPILVAAPLAILSTQFKLLSVDLRGRQQSGELGFVLLSNSALALLCGLLGYRQFGVAGSLIGEACATAVVLVGLCHTRITDLRYSIPRAALVLEHVRFGLPFALTSFLAALNTNLTGWAITFCFGSAVLGQYSLAMILFTASAGLQDVMTTLIAPATLFDFGRDGDIRPAIHKAEMVAVRVMGLYAIAAVPVWLVFEWFIARFYPEFRLATTFAPWIYLAAMCECANLYEMVFLARMSGALLFRIGLVALASLGLAYAILAVVKAPAWTLLAMFAASRVMVLITRAVFARRYV